MKETRLAASSLANFLDQVPDQVGDILDDIKANKDTGTQNCIPIVLHSLQALTREHFGYLPEGEQVDILAHCGTWLDIGMMIGSKPDKLKEILVNTKAKVVVVAT